MLAALHLGERPEFKFITAEQFWSELRPTTANLHHSVLPYGVMYSTVVNGKEYHQVSYGFGSDTQNPSYVTTKHLSTEEVEEMMKLLNKDTDEFLTTPLPEYGLTEIDY